MPGSFGSACMNVNNANIVLKSAIKSRVNNVNVGHFNANSILSKGKLDEIRFIVSDVPFDVICVSETWLHPVHEDTEVNIDGYTLIRNDRALRTHGGVGIYVRNELQYTVISKSNGSHTEFLFIAISLGDSEILVGSFYRPPDVYGIGDIESALSCLHPHFSDIILIGDFNINVLVTNTLSNRFRDYLESIDFHIANVEPTHFTDNSSTQIDLIICNKPRKMIRVNQVGVPGISKHDLIFCCYEMYIDRQNSELPSFYRSFRHINCAELFSDVQRTNWSFVYDLHSVDDQVKFLNYCITDLYYTHVPLRKNRSRCKKYPAWFNSDVSRALLERDIAYQRWKSKKTVEYKLIYHRLRNIANRICRDAKRSYFHGMFPPKSSQKSIWKNLSVLGVAHRANPTNRFTSDEVSEYFTTSQPDNNNKLVFPNSASPNSCEPSNSGIELNFRGVDMNEVCHAIHCIKSSAMGMDNICPKFIKLILVSLRL